MRIAGVMYLHSFDLMPELCMNALADLCTDVCFVMHDITSGRIEAAANNTRKLRRIDYVSGKWTRKGSLIQCIRTVDILKPDVVLLPDDDEILPPNLGEHISKWKNVWDVRPSMCFRQFQCMGEPRVILAENVCRVGAHCKAVRWHEGLLAQYEAKYAGWCWPSALYRQKKYHCPLPMRHLAYMTPEQRQRRSDPMYPLTTRGQWPWWERPRKTMGWTPDLTWKEWESIVGSYRTQEEDHCSS